MKFVAALAGLVLAAAPSAWSQTVADPPAPDPASLGPLIPTPAAMEHARHLLRIMHLDAMMEQLSSQILGPMMTSILKQLPADKRAAGDAMQASIIEDSKTMMSRLSESMVQLYARNLTEQELADIDAFYSSPSGQAVLSKLPQLTSKITPLAMGESAMMMRRAFDRFCSKTACTDADRATMARAIQTLTQRQPPAS